MRLPEDHRTTAVSPLTLRFSDPSEETAFRTERRRLAMPFIRLALFFGLAFFALFGSFDALLAPDDHASIRFLRIVIVFPMGAALLATSWLPSLARWMEQIMLGLVLTAGLGLLAMIGLLEPPVSQVAFTGLVLTIVYGYNLSQLRFVSASATGWGLTIAYAVLALSSDAVSSDGLGQNLFFLVAGNVLGMGASYVMERTPRLDFLRVRALEALHATLKEMNRRLEEEVTRDPLTGLRNRRHLEERLQEAIHLGRRYGATTSVILVDLDDFKDINDLMGHPGGDRVLRAVADALHALLRTSDLAFRYGGDEFLLVLPATDSDAAMRVAERIQESLGRIRAQTRDGEVPLACSAGVCLVNPDIDDVEGLLTQADNALYLAKNRGKGQVVLHQGPPPTLVDGTLQVASLARTGTGS